MKRIIAHIVFLAITASLFAQNIPVRDLHFIRDIEKASLMNDTIKHSSIKPCYFSDVKSICIDSAQYEKSFLYYGWKSKNKEKPSSFYALPVYEASNLFILNNFQDYKYNLHLGALVDYSIGDKFGISWQLSAWKVKMPEYQTYISPLYTIHYGLGSGLGKNRATLIENDFKIAYSPFSFLRLELANSKNFYGDGYRSFLLSDFASNYPYFKLETKFLSLKYSCVWAAQRAYTYRPDIIMNDFYTSHLKKFSVFHYLDWKVGKRLNIGLFESVITHRYDFFSFEYLNPIIFFRPVEFSLGSEDNALLGINIKFAANKQIAFYFQFLIDDIIVGQLLNDIRHTVNPDYTGEYGWFANKWATQLGVKAYDFFGIKNLDFFSELNIARPYVYSHVNTYQNYTHARQPLAHPLGANFVESVSELSYFGKRIVADAKFMYALVGADTTGTHFGQNIFNPTMDGNQGYSYIVNSYGNTILQGIKTNIITAKIDFGYIIRENKNLSLNVGILFRSLKPEIGESCQQTYLYFGVKSNFVKRESIY